MSQVEIIGFTHFSLPKEIVLVGPSEMNGGLLCPPSFYVYSPIDISVLAHYLYTTRQTISSKLNPFDIFLRERIAEKSCIVIYYVSESRLESLSISEIKNLSIGHKFRRFAPLTFLGDFHWNSKEGSNARKRNENT